ncbi:MAG: hypothetical protein PUB66_01700 [Oscillospiraceae bacterium]|nr:hypothetical protein [Oscillospiraceae bacterium]
MNIIDIIKDIFSDAENIDKNHKEYLKDTGQYRYGYDRRNGGIGGFVILLPQLIGWIVGFAFARLLGLGMTGYIILGLIFALGIGTFKNVEYDRISLKYAVLRNIIIAFIFFVIIGIVWLCS